MSHPNLGRINRLASLAVLPVMLLAILAFSGRAQREPALAPPTEGTIAVAGLRTGQLTLIDLQRGTTASLALPGGPHELAALGGRLYLTISRANLLAEVDAHAPGLLRIHPLEGYPHGIAVDEVGGVLYVSLDEANDLVAIDAASLAEIARWPTGETPHAVTVADGVVHVVAARADRLETVRPSGGASTSAGRQPETIATLPWAVVTAGYLDGVVQAFAPTTLEPLATIPIGGGPVRILALDDRTVAVSLQEASRVAIVDIVEQNVIRILDVPSRPDGLCRSPSGAYLAVASNGAATLTVFETARWRVAARFEVPDGPGACLWLPG